MSNFAAGVVKFQTEIFPQKKALFEQLCCGQSPEALFIACSDSRVVAPMITQTDPGELFVCRNAGNIVPPHMEKACGMAASIEFAMAVLNVPHAVICGHTDCSAIRGAMDPARVAHLPHVCEWLGHAKEAVDFVAAQGQDVDETARMRLLLERNILLQLKHLRTHPAVAARLEKGDLCLHGWLYDIRTGDVTAYDPKQEKFIPVSERYAEDVACASRG